MVDRLGRPQLDVVWEDVADAYEAGEGRRTVVVLVASDTPANRGEGLSAPQRLTGPDGEALGYGYLVDPSLVDARASTLIDEVHRRLGERRADWDFTPPA